jgi:hypothetical protein
MLALNGRNAQILLRRVANIVRWAAYTDTRSCCLSSALHLSYLLLRRFRLLFLESFPKSIFIIQLQKLDFLDDKYI